MGIIEAFSGAISGTFADQWKDIYTAAPFNEHTVVVPGVLQATNNNRGSNLNGSNGIITAGSKIYVPENTACFIFNQSGIEEIITEAGGYEYRKGEESVFNSQDIMSTLVNTVKERMAYGGISENYNQVAFVNLREIRGIKFGTKGALVYNDLYYKTDLEVYAYGTFSIKVMDPVKFIKEFVPPNVVSYSFDNKQVRSELLAEFLQSLTVALNSLSDKYRIAQLPGHSNEVAMKIAEDELNAGSWEKRFGFKIVKVSIENVEFTEESRDLVHQYSEKKMDMKAYEDVSERTSNVVAQQKIASGIQENGLGDMGGMIFGMNMAQGLGAQAQQNQKPEMTFDEQIEALKKLKELLDMGILTQEEFDVKKKEIMHLS